MSNLYTLTAPAGSADNTDVAFLEGELSKKGLSVRIFENGGTIFLGITDPSREAEVLQFLRNKGLDVREVALAKRLDE